MTRQPLLLVADGPEHIEIYTSDDEGVVDYAHSFPPVYLTASLWGAHVKLGPFSLKSIFEGVALHVGDKAPLVQSLTDAEALLKLQADRIKFLEDTLRSLRAEPLGDAPHLQQEAWGIKCIEDHNAIIDEALKTQQ